MEMLFKAAEKPILVIGLGAICAGVRDKLLVVAEKFHLPIILTPMAKGMVPESHPCYAGVLFHALSDHVSHTHKQADLVISVGYDPVEFNYEDWMPNVPLISIDTEKADIDREKYTDICEIIGEVAPAIARLAAIRADVKAWDLGMLAERRARMFARLSPESDAFGPCAALDILREELPEEAIMTCDVGAHLHLIGQKWPTPAVGKLLMTNGWSAMGFAIPAAIAAKLCKPELPVCAVAGDGGFLMTVGELAVAVREKLSIVFILFTDNDLSLIRIKQEKKGVPIYGTAIREFGTIGGDSILGVPVIRADDRGKFRSGLQKAFQNDGPVIVEALLDSCEYDSLVLRQN
jgi:acetolactate synthase-1/2/3 large subunit